MSASTPIIVIGAGVLGLSTATLLQHRFPSTPIIIIAAELPTDPSPSADYASMWAGAHYRPIPRSTPQLEVEAKLAIHTAEVMRRIARESPESGVAIMKGVEHLEMPPEENLVLKTGEVYAGLGDGFRVLAPEELPAGVKWGCEYETYCVNVLVYCKWLLDEFLAKGGKVFRRTLGSAVDGFACTEDVKLGKVRFVVNCSGRNFDRDSRMKIIRGQTVLVRQQYDRTVTRQNSDGSWSFLIPRPKGGGTVVGGTKEIGDPEERGRPETREMLLRHAVQAFPEFVGLAGEFEVVMDNVGRRPFREGGLRIEVEYLSGARSIVHGYGAGGRGYEISWGTAEAIVEQLEEAVSCRSRL